MRNPSSPQIKIRPLLSDEYPLLETFLYEAIFQRPGDEPLPHEIIFEPEIHVFIKDFGRPHDLCLLAETEGLVVGAVWTRILAGQNGEPKGFGHLDEQTPEFAISLLPPWRGQGIGCQLLTEMLQLLKREGYSQASLAVQKDNYAVKLYEKVGFTIIGENDQEYIMRNELKL